MICLDVIPGTPGKIKEKPTRAQYRYSAEVSYANRQRATDAGLPSLPTFHQGEPFEFLHRYLDAGVTYLCLSDRGSKVVPWLKECWRHLPPGIQVHLLGATDRKVLAEVPAYSADSSTWLQMAKNGDLRGRREHAAWCLHRAILGEQEMRKRWLDLPWWRAV